MWVSLNTWSVVLLLQQQQLLLHVLPYFAPQKKHPTPFCFPYLNSLLSQARAICQQSACLVEFIVGSKPIALGLPSNLNAKPPPRAVHVRVGIA